MVFHTASLLIKELTAKKYSSGPMVWYPLVVSWSMPPIQFHRMMEWPLKDTVTVSFKKQQSGPGEIQKAVYVLNQHPLYGAFSYGHVSRSKNQGLAVGMVPLTMTPCDPLIDLFSLLYSLMTQKSWCLFLPGQMLYNSSAMKISVTSSQKEWRKTCWGSC